MQIVPSHYYSAIPDLNELKRTKELWVRRSELPGLSIDIDKQVASLKEVCLPYQREYLGNHTYKKACSEHFGRGYSYIEAQALHAVVRYFKPKRIIEVGGGVSTYCSWIAQELNRQEGGHQYEIICIEPYPSKKLIELKRVELIISKVQSVPIDLFSKLVENDLLFIDSSHTVKPGSDVNHLILEVLPRLKTGVIVHFHDIYFPYDYQRRVLKTFFYWMETSLLRAYLIHNNNAEILFCLSLLHYDKKDILKEVFPEYDPQEGYEGLRDDKYRPFEEDSEHFPSSIFIKIK